MASGISLKNLEYSLGGNMDNPLVAFKKPIVTDDTFSIPSASFFCLSSLARRAQLFFSQGKFSVCVDNVMHHISSSDIKGLPSNPKIDQVKLVVESGYLTLREIGNDYGLEAQLRVHGGSGKPKKDWEKALEYRSQVMQAQALQYLKQQADKKRREDEQKDMKLQREWNEEKRKNPGKYGGCQ